MKKGQAVNTSPDLLAMGKFQGLLSSNPTALQDSPINGKGHQDDLLRQREQENTCHYIMATLFWKGIKRMERYFTVVTPQRGGVWRSGAGQTEGGINETLGSR